MTAPDYTAADLLEDAAVALERDGWCRFHFTDPDTGSHCARGAMRAVLAEKSPVYTSLYTDAGDVLMDVVKDSVITWNDAPERTEQEVLDAFRKAAKRAASVEYPQETAGSVTA